MDNTTQYKLLDDFYVNKPFDIPSGKSYFSFTFTQHSGYHLISATVQHSFPGALLAELNFISGSNAYISTYSSQAINSTANIRLIWKKD